MTTHTDILNQYLVLTQIFKTLRDIKLYAQCHWSTFTIIIIEGRQSVLIHHYSIQGRQSVLIHHYSMQWRQSVLIHHNCYPRGGNRSSFTIILYNGDNLSSFTMILSKRRQSVVIHHYSIEWRQSVVIHHYCYLRGDNLSSSSRSLF